MQFRSRGHRGWRIIEGCKGGIEIWRYEKGRVDDAAFFCFEIRGCDGFLWLFWRRGPDGQYRKGSNVILAQGN